MKKTELMLDPTVINAKLETLTEVLNQFKTKVGHIKSVQIGLGRTSDKKTKFFSLKLKLIDETDEWETLLPVSVLDDPTHLVRLINLIDDAHQLYWKVCREAVAKVKSKYFELFKDLYPYDHDVHDCFS